MSAAAAGGSSSVPWRHTSASRGTHWELDSAADASRVSSSLEIQLCGVAEMHAAAIAASCASQSGQQAASSEARPLGKRSLTGRSEKNVLSHLVAALKKCGKTRDLEGGKDLHRLIVAASFHTNQTIAAALITMYGNCRSMELAQEVFEEMMDPSASVWNALMLGYVENGEGSAALYLFSSMDCKPDRFTYVVALKACGRLASVVPSEKKQSCLEMGTAIHKQAKKLGFCSNMLVANAMLDMYSKCGSMNRAREVFDCMVSKNVITWTSLIQGYVQNGQSLAAMDLFERMDCEPNCFTYAAVLKGCAALATHRDSEKESWFEKGVAIHKQVKERGFDSNIYVTNILVDMYSKFGRMHLARDVFDGMCSKDAMIWTSLIQGYVQNGQSLVAMKLFAAMDCQPNSCTYVAALKACTGLANCRQSNKQSCLTEGIAIHKQVKDRGFDSYTNVANSLIEMYSKCGSMNLAREVFDSMIYRNSVSWTTLIAGYAENGESLVAMDLLTSMDCELNSAAYVAAIKACGGLASGKDDSDRQFCLKMGLVLHEQAKHRGFDSHLALATTLVDMYSKCGSMQLARGVFDKMLMKNVVSWNSLIMGYVQNGESAVAIDLFANMDCKPDCFTYAAAIKACGSLAALPVGQKIHTEVCRLGLEQDRVLTNTLMDFYGKCGIMVRALELFINMRFPDTDSWNVLIGGYSLSRDWSQVFRLARMMQESLIQMDSITFICLLTACSQAGLVEQGKHYFESMSMYGVASRVEHYACMVDMLGRANRLEEALALIKRMPVEANAVIWKALLRACRQWNNLEVGRIALDAMAAGTSEYVLNMSQQQVAEEQHTSGRTQQRGEEQHTPGRTQQGWTQQRGGEEEHTSRQTWWCGNEGRKVEFEDGGVVEDFQEGSSFLTFPSRRSAGHASIHDIAASRVEAVPVM